MYENAAWPEFDGNPPRLKGEPLHNLSSRIIATQLPIFSNANSEIKAAMGEMNRVI